MSCAYHLSSSAVELLMFYWVRFVPVYLRYLSFEQVKYVI
nr:MAG TPA: hypothetical protein [Caudoviricetes sp.]